ncbi:MAG: hypothetical protein AAGI38_09395 [Bacteroidota bacterium]
MGKKEKSTLFGYLTTIVGYDDTGIYAVKTPGIPWDDMNPFNLRYELVHYDQNMDRTNSLLLKLKSGKKYRRFELIFEVGGKLYLFSSFKDKKQKKKFLFVESINKKLMTLNDDRQKVFEVDYSDKNLLSPKEFVYKISRDSSKIMFYIEAPQKGQQSKNFEICVMDRSFKVLWKKSITLPYFRRFFEIQKFEVDDFGNVHILGKRYREGLREELREKANFQFHFLSYLEGGDETKDYPIELEGVLPLNIEFNFTENHGIVCAGFYGKLGSSTEDYISVEGVFHVSVDSETRKISQPDFEKISWEYKVRNMVKRDRERRPLTDRINLEMELTFFRLNELVVRRDGGIVLLAQETYEDKDGYENIMAVSLSADNNIEWVREISKAEVVEVSFGYPISFSVAVVADKIHLIFNDVPEHLIDEQDNISLSERQKSHMLVMATLTASGDLSRQQLLSCRDSGVVMQSLLTSHIDEKTVILFGMDNYLYKENYRSGEKVNHRLAKITLP